MKVVVNHSLCDGSGNCMAAAPELFLLGGNGKVLVMQDRIDESLRAKAMSAIRSCPKRAISLIEDAS